MKMPERPRSHRTEARLGDDERQKALVGLSAIALDEEAAVLFLKALERPDDGTVARLAELRRRAR